jgi:hypothetical protein
VDEFHPFDFGRSFEGYIDFRALSVVPGGGVEISEGSYFQPQTSPATPMVHVIFEHRILRGSRLRVEIPEELADLPFFVKKKSQAVGRKAVARRATEIVMGGKLQRQARIPEVLIKERVAFDTSLDPTEAYRRFQMEDHLYCSAVDGSPEAKADRYAAVGERLRSIRHPAEADAQYVAGMGYRDLAKILDQDIRSIDLELAGDSQRMRWNEPPDKLRERRRQCAEGLERVSSKGAMALERVLEHPESDDRQKRNARVCLVDMYLWEGGKRQSVRQQRSNQVVLGAGDVGVMFGRQVG